MLAAEGLVELLPNRGAIAVSLTRSRRAQHLRGDGGPGGAVRRTGGAAHHRRGTGRDPGHALRDDGRLHARATCPATTASTRRSIAPSTRPPRTRCSPSTYNQVNARLQALRFRSNQDGDKWKRAVKEHEKMIEALGARDPAAMREVLLTHLNNKRDVVIEQLRGIAQARFGSGPMNAPLPLKVARGAAGPVYDSVARAQQRSGGALARRLAERNARRGAVLPSRPRPLCHRRLDLPGHAGRRVRAASQRRRQAGPGHLPRPEGAHRRRAAAAPASAARRWARAW